MKIAIIVLSFIMNLIIGFFIYSEINFLGKEFPQRDDGRYFEFVLMFLTLPLVFVLQTIINVLYFKCFGKTAMVNLIPFALLCLMFCLFVYLENKILRGAIQMCILSWLFIINAYTIIEVINNKQL